MEDVSDPPFRTLCKEQGADVVYTEFISSEGLIRKARKSVKKLDIYEKERPVGIQIFGANLKSMSETIEIVAESKPDIIDINFGCPVKKVVSKGAGAGILKNIDLMVSLTDAMVKKTNLPITVKTRLGWDKESIKIVEVAERLQDVGIKSIAIHGRTRAQMYKGNADWKPIAAVKNNPRMRIPVFANGDVNSPEAALKIKDEYGLDGAMIADDEEKYDAEKYAKEDEKKLQKYFKNHYYNTKDGAIWTIGNKTEAEGALPKANQIPLANDPKLKTIEKVKVKIDEDVKTYKMYYYLTEEDLQNFKSNDRDKDNVPNYKEVKIDEYGNISSIDTDDDEIDDLVDTDDDGDGILTKDEVWQTPLVKASENMLVFSMALSGDGGFVAAGYEGKTGANNVGVWKFDANGKELWHKTHSNGAKNDIANRIVRTSDKGFIVAGHTSNKSAGYKDFMVLKLDKDGNKQWLKTFGSTTDDEAEDIIQSKDGSYVVAGWTGNTGGHLPSRTNLWDYMILKLDKDGNKLWEKVLGGKISSKDVEEGRGIAETSDGNFVVGGHMYDYTVDNTMDIYLFKLNKDTGNVIWENKWGGILTDLIYSMKTTKDGGFIISGLTGSNTDIRNPARDCKALLLKLDENGNYVWHKEYGTGNNGNTNYVFKHARETSDGGFLVGGYKEFDSRFSNKVKPYLNYGEAWILRLDKNGDL
uniref:tRNA-dihydrouridine(47) synthase [NAD(P)(+)] n=1 Tax=Stylophora pistillata TaxID=50429 RepID=A0A2B4RAN7_STYPI